MGNDPRNSTLAETPVRPPQQTPTEQSPPQQSPRQSPPQQSPEINPYQLAFDVEEEPAIEYAAIHSPVVETQNAIRRERVNRLKEELSRAPKDVLSYDNDTRNIKIFGNTMPNTSVDSILQYISNHKPSEKDKPRGAAVFLEAWGGAGLPADVIPNQKLRTIAKQAANAQGFGKRVIKWQNLY